jgi:hypothetical protein
MDNESELVYLNRLTISPFHFSIFFSYKIVSIFKILLLFFRTLKIKQKKK